MMVKPIHQLEHIGISSRTDRSKTAPQRHPKLISINISVSIITIIIISSISSSSSSSSSSITMIIIISIIGFIIMFIIISSGSSSLKPRVGQAVD